MPFPDLYEALEKQHNEPMDTLLPKLLNKHGGPTNTAKALKISRTALFYWMKRAGVQRRTCYTSQSK